MAQEQKNIFTTYERIKSKEAQESLLGQSGVVFWLYGNSGSGKTTIASGVQNKLYNDGKYVIVLDGDNIRSGLNNDLGFKDEDRYENIRRIAEVAKLISENGAIVIACFVSPKISMRQNARSIVGDKFHEIYIRTSIETLIDRDTKGFYKKAMEGKMSDLSGINSSFEESKVPELVIDTDVLDIESCIDTLYNYIKG